MSQRSRPGLARRLHKDQPVAVETAVEIAAGRPEVEGDAERLQEALGKHPRRVVAVRRQQDAVAALEQAEEHRRNRGHAGRKGDRRRSSRCVSSSSTASQVGLSKRPYWRKPAGSPGRLKIDAMTSGGGTGSPLASFLRRRMARDGGARGRAVGHGVACFGFVGRGETLCRATEPQGKARMLGMVYFLPQKAAIASCASGKKTCPRLNPSLGLMDDKGRDAVEPAFSMGRQMGMRFPLTPILPHDIPRRHSKTSFQVSVKSSRNRQRRRCAAQLRFASRRGGIAGRGRASEARRR